MHVCASTIENGHDFGLLIGTIEKTNIFTLNVVRWWCKQWQALLVAGYRKQLVSSVMKVIATNKNLGPICLFGGWISASIFAYPISEFDFSFTLTLENFDVPYFAAFRSHYNGEQLSQICQLVSAVRQ